MDKQDIQRIKSLILVMLICCMPVFCGCNDEDENHQQGDTVAQGGRYNGGCRVVARDHAGCQRDHGGQQQAAGDDAHVDPADHNAQVLNAHSGHRAPRGDKVTGDEHDQQ